MRRLAAKLLFRLSGLASRVQTRRWTYEATSWEPFETKRYRRIKMPCRASVKLLERSMHLDWDHWDHWACYHDSLHTTRCECGGVVCVD